MISVSCVFMKIDCYISKLRSSFDSCITAVTNNWQKTTTIYKLLRVISLTKKKLGKWNT
nr:MAG TPA: hypothetical protein [Caudoviricetes sp.]